jgi:hypothetical protein
MTSNQLTRLYDEALAGRPFPFGECVNAQIKGRLHGELILFLSDIAGLASRGEQELTSLSKSERAKFRELASRGVSTRLPELQARISPQTTPQLYALIAATEKARVLILDILDLGSP